MSDDHDRPSAGPNPIPPLGSVRRQRQREPITFRRVLSYHPQLALVVGMAVFPAAAFSGKPASYLCGFLIVFTMLFIVVPSSTGKGVGYCKKLGLPWLGPLTVLVGWALLLFTGWLAYG
ncbi:MAG: hypothetical protein AAF533_22465 [Acidobacteriota bacterium]